MGVRLTVVGCAGSFPGPDSPASCYLVEHEGFQILLDLGSGALGALARHTDIYSIGGVVISHLHADHCIDICGYYVARKYRPGGPAPRLTVYGPHGADARMARAYDLDPVPGMSNEFDFRSLDQKPFTIGPFTITPREVDHPIKAYAFRVEAGGRSLTYSGDTGPCDGLVDLARDTDLALFEASFIEGEDNPPRLHMTGREAAALAEKAGAGRLVLTHLAPWNDNQRVLEDAEGHFSGQFELAYSGMCIDL